MNESTDPDANAETGFVASNTGLCEERTVWRSRIRLKNTNVRQGYINLALSDNELK
jgi:hypothetical protein